MGSLWDLQGVCIGAPMGFVWDSYWLCRGFAKNLYGVPRVPLKPEWWP